MQFVKSLFRKRVLNIFKIGQFEYVERGFFVGYDKFKHDLLPPRGNFLTEIIE